MRVSIVAPLAAAFLAVFAACAPRVAVETTSAGTVGTGVDDSGPANVVPLGTRLTASLSPGGGSAVSGTATTRVVGIDQLDVDISIAGSAPGSVHPWHVHRGTCDADQGVVGPPTAYPTLAAGSDGRGRLLTTVPVTFERGQPYVVDVHRSPTEMRVIVACGLLELQP